VDNKKILFLWQASRFAPLCREKVFRRFSHPWTFAKHAADKIAVKSWHR